MVPHTLLPLLCWLLHAGSAQLRRSSERPGHCTYSFTVPSPTQGSCAEPAIQELRQDSAARLRDLSALQTRLSLLETLVNRLLSGEVSVLPTPEPGVQEELRRLRMEKDEWEGQRGSLEMAYADLLREKSTLEEEKQQLTERLRQGPCPQLAETSRTREKKLPPGEASRWGADGVEYQELKSELTALPASRMIPESISAPRKLENPVSHGNCGELTWIGEPTTYRKADNIAGKYGVWMKDPEAVTPYTKDTIWRVNTVGADIRQVFEYENIDQLIKGYPAKVYVLPRSMESNGAVVYKGSLYYPRRKSGIIVKYDYATESISVQRELPNAGYHGQFPYSWGGYTDIDLAVDEMGLWAIYSTENAKGSIVISQLDPKSLDVKQTWETQIRKKSVANAFMICGTLYTVGSYSSPSTTVNFAFNTQTGAQHQTSIPFKNQYGYASMIDYNPTEKKIYGWDNYNMVAYDVRLSKM